MVSPTFSRVALLTPLLLLVAAGANMMLATNPDHVRPIVLDATVAGLTFLAAWTASHSRRQGLLAWTAAERRLLGAGGILLGLISVRAVHAMTSHGTGACKTAGSLLYRLECMLYSAANGAYSARVLLTHAFALAVAVAALQITRTLGDRKRALTFFTILTFVLFTAAELLGRIPATQMLRDGLFGPQEVLVRSRIGGPFSNYGWAWPYLAPAIAVAFWMAAGRHRAFRRVVGLALGLTATAFALGNGQRGMMLCVFGAMILAAGTRAWGLRATAGGEGVLRTPAAKSARRMALVAAGATITVALILLFAPNDSVLADLVNWTGIKVRKSPISSSAERLILLKFGWLRFLEHPLLGHGHGTWLALSEAYALSGNKPLIFESAHNLYIQLLTELGLLHTAAIVAAMVIAWRQAWKNARHENSGILLWALSVFVFLLATSVQEIDHVRCVYYQWSAYAGILLADVKATSSSNPVAPATRSRSALRRLAPAVTCLLVALLGRWIFPSGLFAYEPGTLPGTIGTLERWAGPEFTLRVTAGRTPGKGFTLFPARVIGDIKRTARLTSPAPFSSQSTTATAFAQATHGRDMLFLNVPNPKRGLRSASWQVSRSHRIDSRLASLRIGYPPVQLSVPLLWTTGFDLTGNYDALVLACRTDRSGCWLAVGPCQTPRERLTFELEGGAATLQAAYGEHALNAHDASLPRWTHSESLLTPVTHWTEPTARSDRAPLVLRLSRTSVDPESPLRLEGIRCTAPTPQ